MDFIKGNEQVKIDPSGIDISGAGHIIIDSEKIIGDICLNGDLSMNGNLEVYGGKIGIGKTPAYNYNLDIVGAINCTGGVYVDGSNVAGSGSGKPIVAKGMTVQIQHKDYNEKVVRTGSGWQPIDGREDGNGFVVKIKPNSVNSKVLISTALHIGIGISDNPRWYGVQLWRKKGNNGWEEVEGANGEYDTTTYNGVNNSPYGIPVWITNSQGNTSSNNSNGESNLIGNLAASYLDSPGTTEEVMYTLYWNANINDGDTANALLWLNRSHTHSNSRPTTSSSLTATEIWDEAGAYIPTDAAIMVDGATDNVGIGTSTPATGLDIHTDLSLNGNIQISGNDTFVITNQGRVGIGNSNPEFPLEIETEIPLSSSANFDFGYFGGSANTGMHNFYQGGSVHGGGYISIKAKGSIWTQKYLLSTSDKRIKTDISLISDDTALNRVNALESNEYHYIDPERRRPMKTIGFIAQEVKEVVPNAVSLQTAFIPDEMRIINEPVWREDASKVYLDIPNLDMSGAFTGKAKFYVSNDPSGNDEVCKEVEIKEVPASAMNEFSTTPYVAEFDESWNNVFFYGKEVSDFHTIDKAQIFALHHSAIQELDRKHKREVEEKNNKIENLEQNISGLNSQVSSLTSRLEALEASVLALQNN